MKTARFTLAIFAAAAMLVSCEKQEILREAPAFTVSISDDAATKVGMDLDGSVYKLYWECGDEVAVWSSNGTDEAWSTYVINSVSVDPSKALLEFAYGSEPVSDATVYKAYYPNSMVDDTDHTLSIPAGFNSNTFKLPLYAESESTTMTFTGLCSVLRFNLSSDDEDILISEAALVRTGGNLSGACSVATVDGKSVLQPEAGDTDNEIAVIYEDSINISTDPVSVTIPVFAGDYAANDLSLRLTVDEGIVRTLNLKQALTARRSTVHSFDLNVDFWNPLGNGTFRDSYVFYHFTHYDAAVDQLIGSDDVFRVHAPYSSYIYLTVDTETDLVTYPDFYAFYSSNYGREVYALHPSRFNSMPDDSYWAHNKVLSYQTGGGLPAVIQLAPFYYMYGYGGWNQTQKDDIIRIAFPEVELVNEYYSISVTGVTTGEDGVATAVLSVNLGKDAKAVITYESNSVEISGEQIDGIASLNLAKDLASGEYSLSVVVKNTTTDAEVASFSLPLTYQNPDEWEQVCTGVYTFANIYYGGFSEGVILYRNKADASKYYYDNPELPGKVFTFTLNNENVITFDHDQYIADHSTYGKVYVGGDDGNGNSYYDPVTGIYHFYLDYYCSAGSFGKGEETFTPDSD